MRTPSPGSKPALPRTGGGDEREARIQERMAELARVSEWLVQEAAERKRAEASLRRSEELHRLLAEHSSDMISKHTKSGIYLYASPACRGLLGYEPDELVGRDPYEMFPPDDVNAVRESHRTIVASPTVYTVT